MFISEDKQILFSVAAAGGSALDQAISAATTGTWGSVPILNVMDCDPSVCGDNFYDQGQRMDYDASRGYLYYWGGNHGNIQPLTQRMYLSLWTNSTSNYDAAYAIPNGAIVNGQHGFGGGPAVDPNTGKVYGTQQSDNGDVQVFNGATKAWLSSIAVTATGAGGSLPFGSFACGTVCFHPGLYTQGAVVFGCLGGVATYDVSGAHGWALLVDGTNSHTSMGDFPLSTYSWDDNAVYIGGGNGGFGTSIWKIVTGGTNNQGVVGNSGALIAAPPANAAVWDDTNNNGVLCSSGRGHGLLLIMRDGTIYQYNSSGNSWSTLGITVPSTITSSSDKWWAFGCKHDPNGLVGGVLCAKGYQFAGTPHYRNFTDLFFLKY